MKWNIPQLGAIVWVSSVQDIALMDEWIFEKAGRIETLSLYRACGFVWGWTVRELYDLRLSGVAMVCL